jgi:hypothetical protein
MKKQTPLTQLRLAAGSFAAIIVLLTLFAFSARKKMVDDVWSQLGMNKERGMEGIRNSFLNGYLHYYGARNIKNIATGNRVEVANNLLTAVKEYIGSDAFKQEYAKVREQSKPKEPTIRIRSKEEIRKDEIAKAEKAIKETEESMKKTTPEVAESLKGAIEIFKQSIDQFKDPENQMVDLYWQGEKQNYDNTQKQYKEDMAKWQTRYPEDSRLMIKSRLKQFIDIAATVDFNAQLKESYGLKKFVNPAYERKSGEWKQMFRAGADVTNSTKKFAEQWLAELK